MGVWPFYLEDFTGDAAESTTGPATGGNLLCVVVAVVASGAAAHRLFLVIGEEGQSFRRRARPHDTHPARARITFSGGLSVRYILVPRYVTHKGGGRGHVAVVRVASNVLHHRKRMNNLLTQRFNWTYHRFIKSDTCTIIDALFVKTPSCGIKCQLFEDNNRLGDCGALKCHMCKVQFCCFCHKKFGPSVDGNKKMKRINE